MDRSLHIRLSEDGADAERLDTLSKYLRQELLGLDLADVRAAPSGESPTGTRASDAMEIGGLIVSWVSPEALMSVVMTVRKWLSRGQSAASGVRLEIDGDVLELAAASTAEQERLIDLFVTQHGSGKGQPWTASAKP